jgi:hypothetical protein
MKLPEVFPYPEEPHPNGRLAWLRWWVGKFCNPRQALTPELWNLMERSHLETLARWPKEAR